MVHQLCADGVEALLRALGPSYSLPVPEGGAHIICAPLPGRAIVSTTRKDGVLWICLDLDKASAHRHARALLLEWQALYLTSPTGRPRPIVEDDPNGPDPATVPFTIPRMREASAAESLDVPEPEPGGRCALRLVG